MEIGQKTYPQRNFSDNFLIDQIEYLDLLDLIQFLKSNHQYNLRLDLSKSKKVEHIQKSKVGMTDDEWNIPFALELRIAWCKGWF